MSEFSRPPGGSGSSRKARVEHALRDVLTQAIANDVRDPRVRAATLLTVSKVELNVDMSVANVYISIVGDDATADGVIVGLSKAARFLRGPVGRELNLQHAPELRFVHDVSIDIGDKLRSIVLEDEARARAAGRAPGDAASSNQEPARAPVDEPASPRAEAPASPRAEAPDEEPSKEPS